MEERERVVKHMWDVYTNSRRIKLPKFWQQAFVAAYEELTSDVPGVRDAAIGEIAKMSVARSISLDPTTPSRSMVMILDLKFVFFFLNGFSSSRLVTSGSVMDGIICL